MVRPIQTVDQVLRLEIGYNNAMAPASLMEAIIEALERGGILDAAGIIYLRGETPAENLVAINLWAPDVELVAGGGIRGVEDLLRLAEAGCDAVLVASALHDGRITIEDLSHNFATRPGDHT